MAKALLAEFIGTFALIVIGAATSVMAGLGQGSLLNVALAHGLTLMLMAWPMVI
jgi:glycerol uptake facilitator-like aquaporin